jgi:predicted NBD/HSP70 family sugar kinase
VNRAAVLGLLGVNGPLGRSEIAERLAISPATVTQTTKDLLRHRLIEERAAAPSRGGRPAQLLGLVGSARHALGVKITPDHLAIVDMGLDGVVRREWRIAYDPTSADALGTLTDILGTVIAELGPEDQDSLLGVGFGVPGGVDSPPEGIVNAHLLGWHDLPLGRRMRAGLHLPVLVENDVNALAVAERLYGTGRRHDDFLIVTIGVGIGAAIVNDGTVFRGAHGDAGEFGHTPTDPNGPRCVCGNHGCLEAVIGDRTLTAQAREAGVIADHQDITHLRAAADDGHPVALEIYQRAGHTFGRALATLIGLVDPEVVILHGEGTAVWRHWLPGFEPSLDAYLYAPRRGIAVQVDRWDDRAWAQGAAALVLAIPFDTTGVTGEQGRLIRARLVGAGAAAS